MRRALLKKSRYDISHIGHKSTRFIGRKLLFLLLLALGIVLLAGGGHNHGGGICGRGVADHR
ncbi:MAG TPA: hypothetical protein PLY52_11425, partial [Methanothrix sp.]|nr:hypothetical protein [Methanothrix sp.]